MSSRGTLLYLTSDLLWMARHHGNVNVLLLLKTAVWKQRGLWWSQSSVWDGPVFTNVSSPTITQYLRIQYLTWIKTQPAGTITHTPANTRRLCWRSIRDAFMLEAKCKSVPFAILTLCLVCCRLFLQRKSGGYDLNYFYNFIPSSVKSCRKTTEPTTAMLVYG